MPLPHTGASRLAPALTLLAALALSMGSAKGYMTSYPSLATMQRDSDNVVIATPVGREELADPAALPGVTVGAGEPVPAVAIETTFRVTASLKGDLLAGEEIRLAHFRRLDPPELFVSAGPLLVDFKPLDDSQWLMFLRHREGPTFVAFDEVEPGWCIVRLAVRLPGAA